jgi:hypothetical protein
MGLVAPPDGRRIPCRKQIELAAGTGGYRSAKCFCKMLDRLASGAGSAVVTEFADDLAFHHDRALGAWLAGNHAGR